MLRRAPIKVLVKNKPLEFLNQSSQYNEIRGSDFNTSTTKLNQCEFSYSNSGPDTAGIKEFIFKSYMCYLCSFYLQRPINTSVGL